jgi:hypothetical protein
MIGQQLADNPGAVEIAKAEIGILAADFKPPHDRIQLAIFDAHAAGKPTNARAIALRLADDPGLEELGGFEYLRKLANAALAAPKASHVTKLMRDEFEVWRLARQREILSTRGVQVGQALMRVGPGAMQDVLDLGDAINALDSTRSSACAGATILSSAEFVRGYTAPDCVIDGIVQRRRLYSNTGVTGSGKTAIMLRLLANIALGLSLAGRVVERGRCLMLAGENPDDVRGRWIALSETMGFRPDEIDVEFLPGVYPISALMPLLQQKASAVGGYSLIGVDTGAAFFDGDNENDNKQMVDYARRLRVLTELPGGPCVIVNTHPIKGVEPSVLVPRGGGAFLNEVDGNLCCRHIDGIVEMHWQGKFRGPEFAPVPFELEIVRTPKLVDSKGRELPTICARPLSASEQAGREDTAGSDERALLLAMAGHPGSSISKLAEALGWLLGTGEPYKRKVHSTLEKLEAQNLAKKEAGVWVLTSAGTRTAKNSTS